MGHKYEADFSKAKKLIDAAVEDADDIAAEIENGPEVPTYIGWGDLYKDRRLRARAESIFTAVKKHTNCLSGRIDDNPFFHPLYLMRYGRNSERCIEEAEHFRNIIKQ